MLYLVTPHNELVREQIRNGRLGAFSTPAAGNQFDPEWTWGADNGAFTGFDRAAFLRMLTKRQPGIASCLFVACPDVVGDWEATVNLWSEWRPQLDAWPVAMVCQDGARPADMPWSECDAVFIGGSTEWKTSEDATALITAAHRHGKWAHVGRVNSFRRLRAVESMGADSADGTFLAFGPDTNLPKLLRWLDSLDNEPVMRLETWCS